MLFFDLFRGEPRIIDLSAGDKLFERGDTSNGLMYVLIKGRVEVLVGEEVVEVADLGAVLGEMALVDNGPRSATVVAMTDTEFAEIDRDRFEFLVAEMPGFAIEVMRLMASRMRKADELLARRATTLV